jgi:hypothetical protein
VKVRGRHFCAHTFSLVRKKIKKNCPFDRMSIRQDDSSRFKWNYHLVFKLYSPRREEGEQCKRKVPFI